MSQIKKMFAHAIVTFVIRDLNDDLLTSYDYYNVVDELRFVVRALHIKLFIVITHTSIDVIRITRQGGTYQMQNSAKRHHEIDYVILTLSSYAADPLVDQLVDTQTLISIY